MKKILFLCLGAVALLSSCVKKNVPPTGDAHIRFVNAIPGSINQDAYINTTKVVTNLAFGVQSSYITYTAGINALSITNVGTTISNLTYNYGSNIGDYATVFFFRSFTGELISGGIVDNMTAPPAGKARVRFVNLHNYLNDSFKMTITGGATLFNDLVFSNASPYFDVDPGTSFTATAATVTNPTVISFNPQAGKIYTIWINGASSTELNAYPFIQNYF
ncbi:DUF4397 domain-containing protein [Mucilaginibacter sp. UR6-11]|uniref:DUF4397 domain-containing protein n=1 Tax=Mucilaginibacter sp. UR6-11 TaxID=1435644 RepID=UPI001E31F428|nr:DUF4397 domain-containing protein [Mucilaginibacter sp. UR6-11]MCC8424486.1 DUF4397 domain-containing protein [Mucilaginibacter sp. UR6-11]